MFVRIDVAARLDRACCACRMSGGAVHAPDGTRDFTFDYQCEQFCTGQVSPTRDTHMCEITKSRRFACIPDPTKVKPSTSLAKVVPLKPTQLAKGTDATRYNTQAECEKTCTPCVPITGLAGNRFVCGPSAKRVTKSTKPAPTIDSKVAKANAKRDIAIKAAQAQTVSRNKTAEQTVEIGRIKVLRVLAVKKLRELVYPNAKPDALVPPPMLGQTNGWGPLDDTQVQALIKALAGVHLDSLKKLQQELAYLAAHEITDDALDDTRKVTKALGLANAELAKRDLVDKSIGKGDKNAVKCTPPKYVTGNFAKNKLKNITAIHDFNACVKAKCTAKSTCRCDGVTAFIEAYNAASKNHDPNRNEKLEGSDARCFTGESSEY